MNHDMPCHTCTRDKELQLQLEEEQRKERKLNRRDAALKAKLTAEARVRLYISSIFLGGCGHNNYIYASIPDQISSNSHG